MTGSQSAATKGKKRWGARWWLGEKSGEQGISVRQRVEGPKAEEIARKLQERDYEKLEIGAFNKLKRVKAKWDRARDLEDEILNQRASIVGEKKSIEFMEGKLEKIKQTDPLYYPEALQRKEKYLEERKRHLEQYELKLKRLEEEVERCLAKS